MFTFMAEKKYSFGQPSIMKAIEPGQMASFQFQGEPVVVDTEWGEKYSVPILLLSHPLYSITSSKGIKMQWQTGAKVIRDIIDLLKKSKEFQKDYYEHTWELTVADDGSYWVNG
jgi:hypothetical protein